MSTQSATLECRDSPETTSCDGVDTNHPLQAPVPEDLGETQQGELPTGVICCVVTAEQVSNGRASQLLLPRHPFHRGWTEIGTCGPESHCLHLVLQLQSPSVAPPSCACHLYVMVHSPALNPARPWHAHHMISAQEANLSHRSLPQHT